MAEEDTTPGPKKRRGKGGPRPRPKIAGYAQRQEDLAAISSGPAATMPVDEFIPAARATRLRQLAAERARRRIEALALYEPLPPQAAFHTSQARVRLLRGSNRGGKTLPAAAEVARAVMGLDAKFPKENGRFFCVGKDQKHVGKVMWWKLSRAGAFKIIRDQQTKEWRAFRPWDAADLAREDETKPSPPLIPHRAIKEIAWENKKEGVPSTVRLHNGWEISFYSSLGKPPQGSDIDGFWFDEEIVDSDWFPEMSARILDRQGKGLWSATPQSGTDQLYELHERAEDCRNLAKRPVEEFVILLSENPHIKEEAKQALAADLDDENRRVRIGGEFAITSYKIYPQFSMLIHGIDYFAIPNEWTRYMVVDPGHQVCACLFAAIPPKEGGAYCGDHVYLFDELYIRDCDAVKFAEGVAHKTAGFNFETFLIDPHMAIHTELGTGRTVAQQYSDALKERRVSSHSTGPGFKLASDDVQAGILAVHGWLRIGQQGASKVRVLRGMLPNFEYEIKRYHKKRVAGQIVDAPDQKRSNHLMDSLRYLALENPQFVTPRVVKPPMSPALKTFRDKQARRRQQFGGSFINLGPASASHAGSR